MFPNDDICNVEVAKKAAHRLFRKYRNLGGNKEGSLGKSEVNRLMKATYEAINMRSNVSRQLTTPTSRISLLSSVSSIRMA